MDAFEDDLADAPISEVKAVFDRSSLLAAGPILTTITDTCGFCLALGGASLVLHRLTV